MRTCLADATRFGRHIALGRWLSSVALVDSDKYPVPSEHLPTVRIATWNVLHTAIDSLQERMREAAAQINAVRPDVLLVQEAAWRDGTYDMLQCLADLCDLQIAARATTSISGEDDPYGPGHEVHAGVLTRLPIEDSTAIPLSPGDIDSAEAAAALLRLPSGGYLQACSAHLHWGGAGETKRFQQVQALDRTLAAHAEKLDAQGRQGITLLGGDFNTTPDSHSVRWLRGLEPGQDGHDAYWVDAWMAGGDGGPGWTSVPTNPLGHATARSVGINRPERNPFRRIDYLFVRGWVHGRAGDPILTATFGNEPLTGAYASDHLGVWTDLVDFDASPMP